MSLDILCVCVCVRLNVISKQDSWWQTQLDWKWIVMCLLPRAVWQSWKISILAHNRKYGIPLDLRFPVYCCIWIGRASTVNAHARASPRSHTRTHDKNIHNIKFRIAFQASEIPRSFSIAKRFTTTSQHLTWSLLLPSSLLLWWTCHRSRRRCRLIFIASNPILINERLFKASERVSWAHNLATVYLLFFGWHLLLFCHQSIQVVNIKRKQMSNLRLRLRNSIQFWYMDHRGCFFLLLVNERRYQNKPKIILSKRTDFILSSKSPDFLIAKLNRFRWVFFVSFKSSIS